MTANATPKYAVGESVSFKTKNPRKFESIIEVAPKRAEVLPSWMVLKTNNWPAIAKSLIKK